MDLTYVRFYQESFKSQEMALKFEILITANLRLFENIRHRIDPHQGSGHNHGRT